MGSCNVKQNPPVVESSTQTVPLESANDPIYTAYAYRKVESKSGMIRYIPFNASPMEVFYAMNDYDSTV